MAPQPLSRTHPDGCTIILNPHALDSRPEIGLAAMRVIALWSEIEAMQAAIFTSVLGVSEEAAVEIYSSQNTYTAKLRILSALTEKRLNSGLNELLAILNKLASSSAKERNKFAHRIWATTMEGINDALLLVDPAARTEYEFREMIWDREQNDPGTRELKPIKPEKVWVYELRDIEHIEEQMMLVRSFYVQFNLALRSSGTGLNWIKKLLTEPQIQEERKRRKQKRRLAKLEETKTV